MKRKKKTFPMRTTLLLLLMMLTSLNVWANETFTVGDLTYIVASESSKTVNVRNYSGTMPEDYNMVIPASVTNPNNSTLYTVIGIESFAFMNETNLKSVSIPASVTRINQQAFEGCTNLKTVSIPEANGVTDVSGDAFSGTKWLNDQPDGVVYVGKVAYLGKNVSGDISINDGAVSISEGAFLNCTGLTSVTIPNSVTYIGSSAFGGCTNLTSITIPNSMTFIGGSAFSGSGLTSITIPNGVIDIGCDAFKGCTSLTSVTIPNSVTSIQGCAFWNCTSLTSITIPASVEIIMNGAFYGCHNLKTVTIYAPSCDLINDDAFSGCNDDLQIYVFSDLVDTYKGTTNWSRYAGKIKGLTGGYCGVDDPTTDGVDESTNVVWVLSGASPNYTLTIGGTGKMASYSSVDQYPWIDYRSSITSLVFESGITSVCDGAFSGYSNLTSVTFQQGVETIGHSAFSSCSGLKSISIPNSVTTIYSGAFSGCTNVETLELGSGLTTIEAGVFSGLTSLTSLTIGDGVKTIEAGAFSGCTGLKNLTIGDGVTSIANVFNNCTNLETIVLGAGLTFLNAGSFDGYTKLKSVTFKNGTSPLLIHAAVFRGCTSLETVTLPNNVTQIGTNAFSGCTNLTSVALNGPTTIGSGAFPSNTTVTIASGLYLHNGSEVLCGDVTDMSKLNDHILNVAIPYIDEYGTMAYCTDFFVIDGSTTYFDNYNDWYVVNSNVTLNWLRFQGNANIILCDGAKLTVMNNNVRGDITAQDLSSASITVYAQSAGTGAIEAGAIESSASDITRAVFTIYGGNIDINRLEAGSVNIYGGNITVNTAENQTKAAILGNSETCIYGGSVTVTANGCNGIQSNQGNILIYGGQVTATATGTGCYGISSVDYIQLRWTKATDFIQASSYNVGQNCDVQICDGQMMSDGTTIYSDYLDAQKDAIAGQKLVPYGFKTKANPHESDYWTSFYYGTANYNAPDGVTIYKAAIDGDHVQLTEVSGGIIRAGEAVILKTTASNVTTDGYLILPLTTTDATGDYSGNELKGVDVDTWQEDGYTYYVLSKKGDDFGFFKLAKKDSQNSNIHLGAHKAYLEVAPGNNAPAFYGFDDSDSEDGIDNVNVNDNVNDNAIYNLAGQKLSKPQKGINIVNGKKVLF